MKDFIEPTRNIDIQALLDMVRYAEEADERGALKMGRWVFPCRTAGCLVGTYCLRTNTEVSDILWSGFKRAFQITEPEAHFLFCNHDSRLHSRCAQYLSGADAIKRLRKFLYYKMRKSELLEDYDAARKASDTGIVAAAMEATQAVAR